LTEGKTLSEAKDIALLQANHATTSLKNQLNVITERIEESSTDMSKYSKHMKEINNELAGAGLELSPENQLILNERLKYYEELYKKAEAAQADYTKELKKLGLFEDREPIESEPEILNSDFSELYLKFIDTIKDFLNVLSSEQLVIVFNLCGYTILILLMTSITTIVIGQDLINYFGLESKYPKLATYIRFQLKLRKYYLMVYIAYFYLMFLILFSVNIFMFSIDLIFDLWM
jgi:uncharacterized protein (UPF0335 family)